MTRFPILFLALLGCLTPNVTGGATEVRPPTASYRYENTIDVGPVEPESMAVAYVQFVKLVDGGATNVTLRIDSPGGSIFLGNRWGKAMEDLKKAHSVKVACVVDGMAYSMAAIILESPLCDARLATARSTILFHNGSGMAKGTTEDLEGTRTMLEALNTAMALTVSTRIGMPLDEYRNRIRGQWVMAAAEAICSNVIDGIVSPSDIAPPAAE